MKDSIPVQTVVGSSAYAVIGELVEGAREIARDYGVRVAIKGGRGRCGMWHYIATPQPHQRLGYDLAFVPRKDTP